ncbi:MAG: methylated-DNA--[protein]-cysteine S-methyltransferase [Planctomycetota bacterium]|nr:methylated-DNA--[protein]-cysteine S-methyltransferase [Planctomycetota bacterium]
MVQESLIPPRQKSVFARLPKSCKVMQRRTPLGSLTYYASRDALHAVLFVCDHVKSPKRYFDHFEEDRDHPILNKAAEQIDEYFAGTRRAFDLAIRPFGTAFQDSVWKRLAEIPYGETRSYGELAKDLGDVKKARAVGMANGRNPISIILPCHRVIGANGSLTGYGGGLDAKSQLLDLEARALGKRLF